MIELWFWTITSETNPAKRRKLRWRMTEADAHQRYGEDAAKVNGSIEIRRPTGQASDMMRSVPAKLIGGQEIP